MSADNIKNLRRSYEAMTAAFPMKAHDNAPAVLRELSKRYATGVLTASTRKLVVDDLRLLDFPVDEMFYIQTSDDTAVHKSDPAVFDPIVAKIKERGIDKADVLYVGDSLKDYEAAHSAGLDFYGITHGTTSEHEFHIRNIRTIHHLDELVRSSFRPDPIVRV